MSNSDRTPFEKAIFRLNSYSFFLSIFTLSGITLKQISILGNTADITNPEILSVGLWLIWSLAIYSYIVEFLSETPKDERRCFRRMHKDCINQYRKNLCIPKLQAQAENLFEREINNDIGSGPKVTVGEFSVDKDKEIAKANARFSGNVDQEREVSMVYPRAKLLCEDIIFNLKNIVTTKLLRDHVFPWVFASTPIFSQLYKFFTA